MALAVDALDLALRADHRQAVIMVMALRLEEAGRDDDLELGRQLLHRLDDGMLARGKGAGEMALVLGAAEIMALEQLRRQDELRALAGRLADQLGDRRDVLLDDVREGELQRGDGDFAHLGTCWLMQ